MRHHGRCDRQTAGPVRFGEVWGRAGPSGGEGRSKRLRAGEERGADTVEDWCKIADKFRTAAVAFDTTD